MEKKAYTRPVVTEHGDAVKQTKGFGGEYWEMYSPQMRPIVIDDEKPKN
jgi:hypothetical protein